MFCTKCGKEIRGTPFCQQCGEKSPAGWLDWPQEPAPASLIAPDKKTHKMRNLFLPLLGGFALLWLLVSFFRVSSSSPSSISTGTKSEEAPATAVTNEAPPNTHAAAVPKGTWESDTVNNMAYRVTFADSWYHVLGYKFRLCSRICG